MSRGHITIEASIVFPLIFIIFISLLLASIFIFNSLVSQSNRHIVMREKSGKISNTLKSYSDFGNENFEIREKNQGLSRVLLSEYSDRLSSIYKKFIDLKISGRDSLYIIDEKKIIGIYGIIKDKKNK